MKYVPALDGIRAFAVLLVIMFHAGVPLATSGYRGVDVFFVLSGFLITALLLDEIDRTGGIRFVHFYLRRIYRLYPALLLLLVLVLLGFFWGALGISPGEVTGYYRDAGIAALYMSDFAIVWQVMPRTSVIMHTWSLSIEEHYYILWPLALLLLRKHVSLRRLSCILGYALLLAWAWKLFGGFYFSKYAIVFRFDMRISGLLLGGWLAAYRHEGGKIPACGVMLGVFFGLFLLYLPENLLLNAVSYNLGAIATELFTCCLIYTVLENKDGSLSKFLGNKAVVYLGRISYGLYLFHYPIAAYMQVKHYSWETSLIVTGVLSLIIASLSYFLLELPILGKAKKYRTRHLNAETRP